MNVPGKTTMSRELALDAKYIVLNARVNLGERHSWPNYDLTVKVLTDIIDREECDPVEKQKVIESCRKSRDLLHNIGCSRDYYGNNVVLQALGAWTRVIYVDVETTGLQYTNDEVVSFAAALCDSRYTRPTEVFDSGIIFTEKRIDTNATKVNKITNEMIEKGRKPKDVAKEFIEWLGKGDCILAAHNASFDHHFFVKRYLDRYLGVMGHQIHRYRTICSSSNWRMLRSLDLEPYASFKGSSLSEIHEFLRANFGYPEIDGDFHTAKTDVIAGIDVLNHIAHRLINGSH